MYNTRTGHIGLNNLFIRFTKGLSSLVTSGPRHILNGGIHEDPPRMCISKKGRIDEFDWFARRFPQELPSTYSKHAIPPLFAKQGHGMLDYPVLLWVVWLFQTIVWYWGSLFTVFLLALPSKTKVGPTGGGIWCMRGQKTPPSSISSSRSVAPSTSGVVSWTKFSFSPSGTLISGPCCTGSSLGRPRVLFCGLWRPASTSPPTTALLGASSGRSQGTV